LGGVFLTLGVKEDALHDALSGYERDFLEKYRENLRCKFGLASWEEGDDDFVESWWRLLHGQRADFTLAFRRLAGVWRDRAPFLALFRERDAAEAWLARYRARLERDSTPAEQRERGMLRVNPVYVLRNHLAQQAIDAAKGGDAGEIETLLFLLRDPYTERPG